MKGIEAGDLFIQAMCMRRAVFHEVPIRVQSQQLTRRGERGY